MKTDTIKKHFNEDRIFQTKIFGSWIEINEVYMESINEIEEEFPLDSVDYQKCVSHTENQIYSIKEKSIKKFLKDKYRLKRLSISKQNLKELIEYLDWRLDNLLKENEVFYNHKWE